MKRLLWFALALLLYAVFPFSSYGQSTLRDLIEEDNNESSGDTVPPQRIGVPQSQFNLSANGSGSVGGYCFDEYLVAPRRVTRFENVLAGNNDAVVQTAGGTMSLSDAIDRGLVAVRAMQLNVKFTNRTEEPMSIELRRPVVFWDRAGGDVNPMALAALERNDLDYDDVQHLVWSYTSSERRLAVLGYYDGSIWDYNPARLSNAVTRYQRENNLSATGQLDNTTMRHIASADDALRARLREMGFADREGKTAREDLAAQIRAYERYIGQQPSGRWTPDLMQSITGNASLFKQLRTFRANGKPATELLADASAYPNVVTYLNGLNGVMLLVDSPQGIELWNRRNNSLKFVGRGEKAIRDLDDAAAQMAQRASKGDRVVIYPRVADNGMVTMEIDGSVMQISSKELADYVAGGRMPEALERAVAPLAVGSNDFTGRRPARNVILYRGPFWQGRTQDGAVLRKLGMEQIDGGALAKAFDQSYGERIDLFLSNDLRAGAKNLRDGGDSQGTLDPARTHSERYADASIGE